ncbi:hypothetical protein C8D88_108204 [Lentzea atacamensis]|uniref:Uncharacterized protein n=1 Tax=Lentzea atacamensis TaxID=531938 RepID=A0A316HTS3_9PSEU|nr:hypothetical protein C8D88_108204 [Lentzea atacamensis]
MPWRAGCSLVLKRIRSLRSDMTAGTGSGAIERAHREWGLTREDILALVTTAAGLLNRR